LPKKQLVPFSYKKTAMLQTLSAEWETQVRFNEVDLYNIVWNGAYPGYFEAGRQEFGNKFQLSIDSLLAEGIHIPLTKMEIDYKQPLRFNDKIRVITTFVNSPLALMIFTYKIIHIGTGGLACTGRSEQVFLNKQWQMCYTLPSPMRCWKQKWLSEQQ
jgi:acyl-CoA thioester hydrolase